MCWDHPPDDRVNPDTDNRFGGQPFKMMSLQDFTAIIDDLYALGTRRIDLVARGEPLLNKAAIDMVAYAKNKGMYVDMVSNASPLTPQKNLALVNAGLDRLQVSLNAGIPETYPKIHVTETSENYLKVKANLRDLSQRRRELGKNTPYIRVGFVISAINCFEIREMLEAAVEVGADEAVFSHTTVHRATQDLKLDETAYARFSESLPAAMAYAKETGIRSNLATLAATLPPYMAKEGFAGAPPMVPCYAGWYSVMILGNGSVMGCCQCTRSLGKAGADQRFRDIWNSEGYQTFRQAARNLPTPNQALAGCECDNCSLRARNISVHNLLHPFNKIDAGDDAQLFRMSDLLRFRKQDQD
jgi:MoaA/NifB/PqqE/SkfB family radical SAM enzyme